MTLGPLMIDIAGVTLTPADEEILRHPAIGGVILFQRNYESLEQLQSLTARIHRVRKPSLLVAVDQEGGRIQRFGPPLTRLPSAARIGHQFDLGRRDANHLARMSGWLMAAELIACGVDLSFAPVVDIDHQICAVIGDRAFHADPHVVAELGCEFMTGMHEAGMAATAKHFPGHGAVTADSHVTLPVDDRRNADLLDDLVPYELLIANGLDAVMMALVSYPAVDKLPASFSQQWIGEILRGQLGFRGAVFSDDLSMGGATDLGEMPVRVRTALMAGCDIVLICNDRDAVLSVVDKVDCHNPARQVRMASLHRRHTLSWRNLKRSAQWQNAHATIAKSFDQPPLRLDG